jgi:hypothetical protein
VSQPLPLTDEQIRQRAELGRKLWNYWGQIHKAVGQRDTMIEEIVRLVLGMTSSEGTT